MPLAGAGAASPKKLAQTLSSHRREEKVGAGEGDRTLDPDLGKVVLYR
jgi:hypothetical protein